MLKKHLYLKVHGPISQNGDIYSDDVSSPKKFQFQICAFFRYHNLRKFEKNVKRSYQAPLKVIESMGLSAVDSYFFVDRNISSRQLCHQCQYQHPYQQSSIVTIRQVTSTLVVALYLRPLRSNDRAGVKPSLTLAVRRYAAAQIRNKR